MTYVSQVEKHSKTHKLDRSDKTGRRRNLESSNTRITHDLRKINAAVEIPPPVSLPVITDLIPMTAAGQYMSGFDLKSGKEILNINEDDVDLSNL